MVSIGSRIEKLNQYLKVERAEYYAILNPPLTDDGIVTLEEKYNIKLPADLKALYQWKNGHGEEYTSAYFIDFNLFFSLDISLRVAREHTEMFGCELTPENWWNKNWIPILMAGNDFYCYDLEGAFTGNKGQIIRFIHDDNWRPVVAPNLAAFLKHVNNAFPFNVCHGSIDCRWAMDLTPLNFEANMLISDFQQVLDYINNRQPGFLQTVKGVPRQELEAWQNSYSVQLPSIYLDFMTAMGHSSGAYRPLEWYGHNFEKMASQVARLYSADCPYPKDFDQHRYFQIGYRTDEGVRSPGELFIDLGSSDGNDVRLVEMGENGVYNATHGTSTEKTLGEFLMQCAVRQFGGNDQGYRRTRMY